ncbi:helix-turn-helix domain-containing protein [Pseudomonas sp. XS1P51]
MKGATQTLRTGTDALTLATLAERAGVTKPVAYEHFRTRSGLLITHLSTDREPPPWNTQCCFHPRARCYLIA